MAVTESSEEARIAESSRSSGGRRRVLRVQRPRNPRVESVAATPVVTLASSADAGSGEVINLASSGDEGSGDDAGGSQVNHDDGVTSTRTQQGLPNTPTVRRTGNQTDLTPNFRSAAAMAGWDDEALLMAASGRGTPEAHLCTNSCDGCPQCRERKRVSRTPGQAATPLSAGRRYRRVRRVNEEPLAPIPMATYTDEAEKFGEPGREAAGSQQKPSEGKENKDTESCAKTASVKASSEAAEGKAVKNESLQLDKLREELTCVVCLDICFEPSTTSCGHSFCRGCLQSVYIKCGSRCPKCREVLRATSQNDCPINTVLWNTIQLLFPQEAAARMKDQKSNKESRDKETLRSVEAESQLRLGGVRRRIVRPVPWRELGAGTRERPNVQTSFRRASEVTEYPHGFLRLRVQRPTTAAWRSPDILRQEEEDAALAARLQESFISEAAGL